MVNDALKSGRRAHIIAYGGLALTMITTLLVLPGTIPPLSAMFLADLIGTLLIFGLSVRHNNSSLYDPYWSIAPIYIASWWWAGDLRWQMILILLAVWIWGCRLTFNFFRGWSGLDHEDWRYAGFREKVGIWYWPLSLTGFHLMPTVLVFLGIMPVWYAFTTTQTLTLGANLGIGLGVLISVGATALEALADEQLKDFRDNRQDPSVIMDVGVWSWCRHPNYLGEVLFWWGLWLACVSANSAALWTAIGPLSITVLFVVVSIPLIENRMLRSRPHYQHVIDTMHSMIPLGRQPPIPDPESLTLEALTPTAPTMEAALLESPFDASLFEPD
ncbi:MAG: DUF1295 domain-containing protein [Myxococcota bacterium]